MSLHSAFVLTFLNIPENIPDIPDMLSGSTHWTYNIANILRLSGSYLTTLPSIHWNTISIWDLLCSGSAGTICRFWVSLSLNHQQSFHRVKMAQSLSCSSNPLSPIRCSSHPFYYDISWLLFPPPPSSPSCTGIIHLQVTLSAIAGTICNSHPHGDANGELTSSHVLKFNPQNSYLQNDQGSFQLVHTDNNNGATVLVHLTPKSLFIVKDSLWFSVLTIIVGEDDEGSDYKDGNDFASVQGNATISAEKMSQSAAIQMLKNANANPFSHNLPTTSARSGMHFTHIQPHPSQHNLFKPPFLSHSRPLPWLCFMSPSRIPFLLSSSSGWVKVLTSGTSTPVRCSNSRQHRIHAPLESLSSTPLSAHGNAHRYIQ